MGDPVFEPVFRDRRVGTRPLVVDDANKIMDASIARMLARSPIGEVGVETDTEAPPRAYAFVTSR